MADEECIDEKLAEVIRERSRVMLKQFIFDLESEVKALHGQPLHGLRITLLERLRRKYPRVTFETIDKMLKEALDPSDYKL